MEASEEDGLEWKACGPDFIEADVIRFTETIWSRKGRGEKSRSIRLGSREVVAEVVEETPNGQWVRLRVLRSDVTESLSSKGAVPLKPGEVVRRKRLNVSRSKCARLLWSDESARIAVVVSRRKPS